MENTIDYKEFINRSKKIYSYLEDYTSKNIFKKRLDYSITKSTDDLKELISFASNGLKEEISNYKNTMIDFNFEEGETIILYGIGVFAKWFINSTLMDFTKYNIIFCNSTADQVKEFEGYRMITPEKLYSDYSDCKVIICVINAIFRQEIFESLINNNIKAENINININIICDHKNQYFDEIIKFEDDEIFLDAGTLNGGTSFLFAEKTNYKKIYMFEPDKESYENTIEAIKNRNFKNAEIFNLGVWDKKETLKFTTDFFDGNKIDDEGTIEIDVDSIDNVLGDTKVTFIKMDIEGAELNALEGAKNIITNYKPKLAISLYHKDEDIFEIPEYIKSLVPEYKIYLRHYTNQITETVLYAVL